MLASRRRMATKCNMLTMMGQKLFQLPFRVGVFLGLVSALGCIPLVFHKDTAVWFNDTFVHEVKPDELANSWQVGEWTWGWMEPALGTLSFSLLTLQLTRQYMLRMHWGECVRVCARE